MRPYARLSLQCLTLSPAAELHMLPAAILKSQVSVQAAAAAAGGGEGKREAVAVAVHGSARNCKCCLVCLIHSFCNAGSGNAVGAAGCRGQNKSVSCNFKILILECT